MPAHGIGTLPSCESGQPQPLARALRALPRGHHDRPRRDDRERRLAVDSRRPRVLAGLAGLGRERLPPHLRRLPASGRPARGSVRAPAALSHRDLGLHCRFARVRARHLADIPHRRARGSGPRRRHRLRRRALADHDHVHRARRTCEGDGRRRLRALRRRDCRRAPRRHPHGPLELALDLSRQHPRRRRRLRALGLPLPDGRKRRPRSGASTLAERSP